MQLVHMILPKMTGELVEPVCEVLSSWLEDKRLAQLQHDIPLTLLQALTSPDLLDLLSRAIQDGDEDQLLPICKLLALAGETFISFIVKNLDKELVVRFLQLLTQCTSAPSHYPSNPDISLIRLI